MHHALELVAKLGQDDAGRTRYGVLSGVSARVKGGLGRGAKNPFFAAYPLLRCKDAGSDGGT